MFVLNFKAMQDYVADFGSGKVLTLEHLRNYKRYLAQYIVAPKPRGSFRGSTSDEDRLLAGICWYIRFEPEFGCYADNINTYNIWDAMASQDGSTASEWNMANHIDGRTEDRLNMARAVYTELCYLIDLEDQNADY